MASLLPLPAYRVPNALSFEPVQQALEGVSRNAMMQQGINQQEKAGARADRQLNMQEAAASRAQARQEAQQAAAQVQAVMGLPEGQRQQAWQHLLTQPGFKDLPPHMRDLNTAAPLITSKAEEYRQRHEVEESKAKLGLMGAQTGLANAQAKVAGQKDIFNEFIVNELRGAQQPQPQPQPQGGVQPQSFNGGAQPGRNAMMPVADTGDQPDPNLILAQTAPQGGAPAQAQPDMVDTPMGPMTRERARKLGLALALGGKGEAGKMFAESTGSGLGKEGQNKLDKDFLDAADQHARLRTIGSSMDPKYLQVPFRINMWGKSLASKAGALKKEDQEELYKYSTFRRDAASNLNLLVKERSGGAVTPQEFDRQGVEIPNPGNGIFDGDDPVTFKAKYDRAYEVVTLGIARNAYLRKADPKNAAKTVKELSEMLPVERMRDVVNNRAKAIEGELIKANPGIDKRVIDREVDMRVKREFGI